MERKYATRIYFLIWTWTQLYHCALSGGFSILPRHIYEFGCPDFALQKSGHRLKIWTKHNKFSITAYLLILLASFLASSHTNMRKVQNGVRNLDTAIFSKQRCGNRERGDESGDWKTAER